MDLNKIIQDIKKLNQVLIPLNNSEIETLKEFAKYTPNSLPGNSFYVNAATGNDATGNGTNSKPWKTLKFALSKMPPRSYSTNSTIYLADGTYTVTTANDLSVYYGAQLIIIGNINDPSKVIMEQTTANTRIATISSNGSMIISGVTFKTVSTHTASTSFLHAHRGNIFSHKCVFQSNSNWVNAIGAYDNSNVMFSHSVFQGPTFRYIVDVRGSDVVFWSCTVPNPITVDVRVINAYSNASVRMGGVSGTEIGISGSDITGQAYTCSSYSRIGYLANFTNKCSIAGTTASNGAVY